MHRWPTAKRWQAAVDVAEVLSASTKCPTELRSVLLSIPTFGKCSVPIFSPNRPHSSRRRLSSTGSEVTMTSTSGDLSPRGEATDRVGSWEPHRCWKKLGEGAAHVVIVPCAESRDETDGVFTASTSLGTLGRRASVTVPQVLLRPSNFIRRQSCPSVETSSWDAQFPAGCVLKLPKAAGGIKDFGFRFLRDVVGCRETGSPITLAAVATCVSCHSAASGACLPGNFHPLLPKQFLAHIQQALLPAELAARLAVTFGRSKTKIALDGLPVGAVVHCLIEENLLCRPPTLHERALPYFSVELKPKGGLPLLPSSSRLPSRYELVQRIKNKAQGTGPNSIFNPRRWFNACSQPNGPDAESILRAEIMALTKLPNKNIRLFKDGSPVYWCSEIEDTPSAEWTSCVQALDFFNLVVIPAVTSAPELWQRIQLYQCFCEGQQMTAQALMPLTRNFRFDISHLREAVAHWNVQEVAKCTVTFDDAVTLQRRHLSEGLALVKYLRAIQGVDYLDYNASAAQVSARKWLLRYFVGRSFSDCSVIVNFLCFTEEESHEMSSRTRHSLTEKRFQPLEKGDYSAVSQLSLGVSTLPALGSIEAHEIWFRMSVVDIDIKPVAKIPMWSEQFRRCLDMLIRSSSPLEHKRHFNDVEFVLALWKEEKRPDVFLRVES